MNNFQKSLDNHIMGINDPNAPFNQSDDPTPEIEEQFELLREIQKLGYNIVNCGGCGDVFIHRIPVKDNILKCPYCDYESEECDFPDLFY